MLRPQAHVQTQAADRVGNRSPRFIEKSLISGDRGTLAVDLDGQVIGDVEWHAVNYGPPPMSIAYNIGIRLNSEYRGHGHGTAAQRMLPGYTYGALTDTADATCDAFQSGASWQQELQARVDLGMSAPSAAGFMQLSIAAYCQTY